jgi:copper chaperone CopZ
VRAAALLLIAGCAGEPRREAPAEARPEAPAAAPVVRAPDKLTFVHLKAIGMECASCLRRVEQALARIDAVYQVGFDLPTDSIYVAYEPTLESPGPLLAAIEQAGFEPAWVKAEAWPAGASATVVRR